MRVSKVISPPTENPFAELVSWDEFEFLHYNLLCETIIALYNIYNNYMVIM